MHRIWPPTAFGELDGAALEQLYSYPADRPWLALNFVTSADGGITVDGHSAPLSVPADRAVFKLGSDLADAVLLGAGTAVGEGFTGIHPDAETAERRGRLGLAPVPPIAVVTRAGASLPADAPVLTEPQVPTLVITTEQLPAATERDYRKTGAQLLVSGASEVDIVDALEALRARGLHHIDCEGGPRLAQTVLQTAVADELRLTVSPFVVGGQASRLSLGPAFPPQRLRLDSAVGHDDAVLLRYLLERGHYRADTPHLSTVETSEPDAK